MCALRSLPRKVNLYKFINFTYYNLGKRGISYRGGKMEAAHTLEDKTANHGNFLEILLLIAKSEPVLQQHINECILKSKSNKSSNPVGKIGRGNFVSLISKTTVNNVIDVIAHLIKQTIVNEANSAGLFSLQIDSTQDITAKDQCSTVIRYTTDKNIKERLLSVLQCTDSTGKGIKDLTMDNLRANKLDVKKCANTSTDGAANMQAEYNGFSAWLAKESPGLIHI